MIIKTLCANAAAIYLSPEELDGKTDGSRLYALIRQAQATRGLPVWKSMDANLFVRGDQILLLAWPTQASAFSFTDFESLLSAALCCPGDTTSSLTYLNGDWLLLVHCPAGKTPAALYEYGTLLPDGERLSDHFAEHGGLIFAADAVALLQKRFAGV